MLCSSQRGRCFGGTYHLLLLVSCLSSSLILKMHMFPWNAGLFESTEYHSSEDCTPSIPLVSMFIYFICEYIVDRGSQEYRYLKALSLIMLLINLMNRTDILSGNFSPIHIIFSNFILDYLVESLSWILFRVLDNFLDQEKFV